MSFPKVDEHEGLRRVKLIDLGARIRRFRATNLSKLNSRQVLNRISRIADGYMTRTALIGANGVFRARINTGDDFFRNSSELWYPPSEVVQVGRFNLVQEPKFYASNSPEAAIWEVQPKVGDFVTVLYAASFQPNDEIALTHVGLHEFKGDQKLDTGNLRTNDSFRHMLKANRIEKKWMMIDDLFSEYSNRIVTDQNASEIYKVTNALDQLFSGVPRSGTLYPSIASNSNFYNICILPDDADRYFFPGLAWVIEIVDWTQQQEGFPDSPKGYFQISVRAETSPIPIAGNLNWFEQIEEISPAVMQAAIERVGELRKRYATADRS